MLRRLSESGADREAPREFVDHLAARVRSAAARALLVDAEAASTLAQLEAAGIACVLLKGVARRAAAGRWPCVDARTTTDVDLLVRAADATRAWGAMQAAGYRPVSYANPTYHLPALIGPGRVAVELHTSLTAALPADEAWRRMAGDALEIDWQGHRVRIPAATELLWHGVIHAQPHELKAWRLRYLLDAAAPLAGDDPINWKTVAARLDAGEVPDAGIARRWLGAAADLAGVQIPASVTAGAAPFDIPTALGWRLAVLARTGDAGLGARLLEEGTRMELGMPPAEVVPGTGMFKQTRRWLGGRAARGIYRLWRATRSRP